MIKDKQGLTRPNEDSLVYIISAVIGAAVSVMLFVFTLEELCLFIF